MSKVLEKYEKVLEKYEYGSYFKNLKVTTFEFNKDFKDIVELINEK